MRNLTDAERESLYAHSKCPFCESRLFFEGPHGGMSTNWHCAGCGAGFNLGPVEFPQFGQLIGRMDRTPYKLGQLRLVSVDDMTTEAKSITCLRCGSVSYNDSDIEKHYCGRCYTFLAPGQFMIVQPVGKHAE